MKGSSMTQLVKKISAILSLSFLLISCGQSDAQKKTYNLLSGTWSFEDIAVKNSSGTYMHAGTTPSPKFLQALQENGSPQNHSDAGIPSQSNINPQLMNQVLGTALQSARKLFVGSTFTFFKEVVEVTKLKNNQRKSSYSTIEYHENSFTLTDANNNVTHFSFEYIDNRLYIAEEKLSKVGMTMVFKRQ